MCAGLVPIGRVDVIQLRRLGMLRIPCFSSLSIEKCHNILPCERTSLIIPSLEGHFVVYQGVPSRTSSIWCRSHCISARSLDQKCSINHRKFSLSGEGVDIPEVECVINAEGGKDEKKTWQRQRNLTIVEGSDKVPIMIDFYDDTCSYFRRHSKARLRVYKSEPEFKTEILEWR